MWMDIMRRNGKKKRERAGAKIIKSQPILASLQKALYLDSVTQFERRTYFNCNKLYRIYLARESFIVNRSRKKICARNPRSPMNAKKKQTIL